MAVEYAGHAKLRVTYKETLELIKNLSYYSVKDG